MKGALEEVSHALDNQGIHMLGHIKHGSCHSRAILFKVLADTVGLESMLMVVKCHLLSRYTFSSYFCHSISSCSSSLLFAIIDVASKYITI